MDAALVMRDPEIMSGALCFSGTWVPVKNLFDYLEGSSALEEFLEDFPAVSRERAVAVLEAARAALVQGSQLGTMLAEDLLLDQTHFAIDSEMRDALQALLDNPPEPTHGLRRLLSAPTPWDSRK